MYNNNKLDHKTSAVLHHPHHQHHDQQCKHRNNDGDDYDGNYPEIEITIMERKQTKKGGK